MTSHTIDEARATLARVAQQYQGLMDSGPLMSTGRPNPAPSLRPGIRSAGWAPYAPTIEDRSLPHQIVIRLKSSTNLLTVTCTCIKRGEPILTKTLLAEGEAMSAYKEWHAERGIEL